MSPRRPTLACRLIYSAIGLMVIIGAPGARAQGTETCADVTVSGLTAGFPDSDSVFTNRLADNSAVRGQYVNDAEDFFIWYAPGDPTEWTAVTPDATLEDCSGVWVVSSYPPGDTFTDSVWYEKTGVGCAASPEQLGSEWTRLSSSGDQAEAATVVVSCFTEASGDDGGGGLSNRTLVVLLIVIGIGFMVLMCLGALACCIHRGKQPPEDNIMMPPGELPEEGSVVGAKLQSGDALKPGLHAHPEIEGAQHPRPEDWAPSYNSNRNINIPTGSRSGPSVRSIGYT